MPKSHDNVIGHYADTLAGWQVKILGPAPSRTMLAAVHGLGLRPGKQALANAMALRPNGVTGSEIVIACGAPQLNRMRGLIADQLVKREHVPHRNGHTVYKLALTPKGLKRIDGAKADTADKVEAKPAKVTKPKAVKKPKAPKAPATEPAPAPVTEPATTDQPQG